MGTSRRATAPVDDEPARRYGRWLAAVFLLVGVVLLVLAAVGRGWSFLLGAIDFLVVGAVLFWAVGHPRPRGGLR